MEFSWQLYRNSFQVVFFFTKMCKKNKGKEIKTIFDNDKIKEEGKEILD